MPNHPTPTRTAFAQRIAPTGLTLAHKFNLTNDRIESFFAPPTPDEILVVWPGERARKGLGDYLYLVQADASHRHDTWYVRMRPVREGFKARWSTGYRKDELPLAKEAYLDCLARLRDQELKRIIPGGQPVAAILEEYIDYQYDRVFALRKLKPASLDAAIADAARLIPFIQDKTVDDIDKNTSAAWMLWARGAKPAGGGYSHNTALGSINLLRAALERGLKSAGYVAPFEIPRPSKVHNAIFLPHEIDRVPIAAANGWIWDHKTNDWKMTTDKYGQPVHATVDARTAESVKPYGRYFLLGIWFGSRSAVTTSLTWTDEGGSWLDLDRGVLHRLGSEEEESTKRKGFCVIPAAALPILKAWRKEDRAHGCRYVIHKPHFAPITTFRHYLWYKLLEMAGSKVIKPHSTKHTCVHILKLEGVSLQMAADYLFTRPETLVAHYGPDWDLESTRPAADALGTMTKFRAAHSPKRSNLRLVA